MRAGTPEYKLNTGQHQKRGQPWHGGFQCSGDAPPGVWDHDPADDFQMPNGTSIPVNSSEEEIYSYGMTWAVGEHSLFTQPLDSSALNFTPFFLSRLRQENESQYQLAASQCHGSKECIYDSLSTGNLALGLATQSLAVNFQQRKTALSKWSTSSPLRGNGLDITGQCPAPFLGSLTSYETQVIKVLDLHCPAGLSPVLGDATSRNFHQGFGTAFLGTAFLASLQNWEMPPCCTT